MTTESATATSPYLSLRQAVRPAILAHRLLAGDQERAGKLATECEDLLYLTRELLKAAGRARILAAATPPMRPQEGGGDRQAQLLEAYADAGLLWAKVVGSSLALAAALIERGEWEDVRALASFLAGAGEQSAAAELRIQLGREVWETHREQLRAISNDMPPAAIEPAINALRAVLREVPEEYPDRNREVNRLLPPLASAVHAIMKEQEADIPYHSRVEHIATGGVAKYPDIVTTSLDELAAEFEGICRHPGETTTQGALCKTGLRVHAFRACASGRCRPRTSTTAVLCLTRLIKVDTGERHGWGYQRYRGTGRIQGAPDAVQSRAGRELRDHAGPLARARRGLARRHVPAVR